MPYIPSFERIFKEEGHAIGLAEGREEGREEGEREGCRKSLQTAIKTRFSRSAEKLLRLVASLDDVNTLEAALQVVLKAKTASDAQKALAKLR